MDYAVKKYDGGYWYVPQEVWTTIVEAMTNVKASPNVRCEMVDGNATMVMVVY